MCTMKDAFPSMGRRLHLASAASLLSIPLALGLVSTLTWSAQAAAQELAQTVTEASGQVQEPGDRAASVPVVPQQIRYAGKLSARAGEQVEAEFRIYAAPDGGEPLWTEAQQVQVQLDGSYSVLLGAASPAGLPQAVFAGGAARWLGVSVDRSQEQERVLLSSVPYAMKSADAESLAGHAASDFVTQEQLAALAAASAPAALASQSAAASAEARPDDSGPITGVGTANAIALFTGANAIGNANIVQSGMEIGINETTPAAMLDVGGTETVRGELALPSTNTATTGGGFSSQPLELSASAWSTAVPGAVAQNFVLESTATGNNTATPGGSLQVLYGSGTNSPTPTGFYISSNGKVTFTNGQTFPDTLANVVANSPLTAVTSAGISTIGLSTGVLETTLNTVYPQLAAANSFHGTQTINGGLTLTSALTGTTETLTGALNSYGAQSTGTILLKAPNPATATTSYNSPVFMFTGSAYNSGTSAAVNQNFSWQAVIQGNNTATPSANLALLAGTGNANQSPTGLSISPKGIVNFVSGQTFPGGGGGTITGITTTSPLTGSGTSGSVALGLNESTLTSDIAPAMATAIAPAIATDITPALQTTFDARYAQLASSNTFYGDYNNYFEGYTFFDTGAEFEDSILVYGPTGDDVIGVYGHAGYGTSIGVKGYSAGDQGYGVVGDSDGDGGWGVYGWSRYGIGVLGVSPDYSNTYTNYLANGLLAGVWGDSSLVAGAGVNGTADNAAAANFINNSAAYHTLYIINNSTGGTGAAVLSASTPNGSCDITDGDFACTGQLKTLASIDGGARMVETYAVHSAENWMEDFGTGTLERGVAHIRLDKTFSETVANSPDYHVFLTPGGDCRGLYVINKTAQGFEVRESGGGTSSLEFDYRIVAKRLGFEKERLADVTEHFRAEEAKLKERLGNPSTTPSQPRHMEQPFDGHRPPGSMHKRVHAPRPNPASPAP